MAAATAAARARHHGLDPADWQQGREPHPVGVENPDSEPKLPHLDAIGIDLTTFGTMGAWVRAKLTEVARGWEWWKPPCGLGGSLVLASPS